MAGRVGARAGGRGSATLDFGPRRFRVVFDELLRPIVLDEDGAVKKSLPKATRGDDAAKADEATRRLEGLKKDVKSVAKLQLRRLEDAMTRSRRWSMDDFQRFFVQHPLIIHLTRRLVWGTYGKLGALRGTFRVTEDGTFANSKDDAFAPKGAVSVGVVHPLDLPKAERDRWGGVFADYEIAQPFAQIGREVFTPGDAKKRLASIEGTKVPVGAVLGLTSHGWRRGPPQDSGWIGWMERDSSVGMLMLELEEGLIVGDVDFNPTQTLNGVTVDGKGKLATLSPIETSELAYSLLTLG